MRLGSAAAAPSSAPECCARILTLAGHARLKVRYPEHVETRLDEVDRDIAIIVVDGGLNSGTAHELAGSVEKMVAAGVNKLIIDCSQLTALTSTGLGAMLALHGRMSRLGGDVKVAGLTSPLMQVVRVMRLDRVFGCYADVNLARAAFRTPDTAPRSADVPPPPPM